MTVGTRHVHLPVADASAQDGQGGPGAADDAEDALSDSELETLAQGADPIMEIGRLKVGHVM